MGIDVPRNQMGTAGARESFLRGKTADNLSKERLSGTDDTVQNGRVLKTATGFDVRIADINDPGDYGFVAPHPNVFKAYFMGEGTLQSKRARALLNELKQSHTTFTMNDRTEIISDNRTLEEMKLRKLFPHRRVVWYSDLLDGRKLLDGSSLLYPYMRYNLMLGFKYMLGGFETPTDADLQKVKFRTEKKTESVVKAGAIRIASDIIFWNTHLLDGSWNLDGSHRLDVLRGYELGVAIVAMAACAYNEATEVLKLRSRYETLTGSDIGSVMRSRFELDFGTPSIWTESYYSTAIRRWGIKPVTRDWNPQSRTDSVSKEKMKMQRSRSLPRQGITGFLTAAIR